MKELIKNKLYFMTMIAVGIVVIIVVLGAILNNGKASVDTKYILSKLEKSSELTTSKLTYEGFSHYKDEGIGILTRSDFYFQYTAIVRAGIDVKEVKVDSNSLTKTVTITIPKATILDVKIQADSIQYYNEGFALFNWDSKQDANKAQTLAEEDAKKKIADMGLLDMADNQAEALIKGLVQDLIPKDYSIKVKKSK